MHRIFLAGLVLATLALSPASIAIGQSDAEPSAAASSTRVDVPSPEATQPAGMLAFEQPSWTRVALTKGPAAREDHTWTVDQDGRYAYLFGGRDGGNSFDDLWRYDLEADSWEQLKPPGKSPSPRFGHSSVWVDEVGLIVFAGQRGTDFFGDLWVYDPASGRWSELPDDGGAPKPRYGSCMIVGPDGRLWISHGFTFTGRFDDTRAYNLRNERWAAITPAGRKPGERCLHDCFTSSSGQMVLYGGQDNSVRALGDPWVTTANGKWKREANPKAKPRRLYAVTEAQGSAYLFGGAGTEDQVFDDLWRVDRETLAFEPVKVPGAGPSARSAGTLITDAARGRLLLFGGKGGQAKSDLWQLTDLAAADASEALEVSPPPPMSEAPATTEPRA